MRSTHNLKKSSSWFWCLLSKSADLSKPCGRFFQIFCVSQKFRTLKKGTQRSSMISLNGLILLFFGLYYTFFYVLWSKNKTKWTQIMVKSYTLDVLGLKLCLYHFDCQKVWQKCKMAFVLLHFYTLNMSLVGVSTWNANEAEILTLWRFLKIGLI